MYLSQQTYYRVSTLDNRLGGAEQRLTDDLSELASSVAHLYSSLTKPLLDCVLVGIALVSFSTKLGAKTVPGKKIIIKFKSKQFLFFKQLKFLFTDTIKKKETKKIYNFFLNDNQC